MVGAQIILERLQKRTNGAARFLLNRSVPGHQQEVTSKGFQIMSTAIERRSVNRRTEDIYRKAIEDIRDYAIFMTDVDGIVTNWNVGAQHILGYTEEESSEKTRPGFSRSRIERKGFPQKSSGLPLRSVARKTNDGTYAATDHVSGPAA